ncbi:MAG: hypothetical protein Q8O19_03580 [Rectinemataceae bacterium]|nr:hypothetical protein [Rectinemataceae bacterium]
MDDTQKKGQALTFEQNVPGSLQDWFKSLPKGGKISIIQKGQEEKDLNYEKPFPSMA